MLNQHLYLSTFCTLFHWKTDFSASCMSISDRLMHYFVVLVITILITPPLWRPLICNTFFLLKKCIYLKVDCLCPTARGSAAAKFYLFWHDVKRWGHFISVLFFSMCRHSTDGSWGNGSEHDESRDLLDWSNNVIHTDSISQCIFGLRMSHEEKYPNKGDWWIGAQGSTLDIFDWFEKRLSKGTLYVTSQCVVIKATGFLDSIDTKKK